MVDTTCNDCRHFVRKTMACLNERAPRPNPAPSWSCDQWEDREADREPFSCSDCDDSGEVLPSWSLNHVDVEPCWCVGYREAMGW